MNAIITALADQGLTLGAILLLAIYLQGRIYGLGTNLRREMSGMKDELRQDLSDTKDELRKEMAAQGERLARIEGLLTRGAIYDAVAEPPPKGESNAE